MLRPVPASPSAPPPAQYYPHIAERILDLGVSVRKRVIRILRAVCIDDARSPHRVDACERLLTRVADEEASIQVRPGWPGRADPTPPPRLAKDCRGTVVKAAVHYSQTGVGLVFSRKHSS